VPFKTILTNVVQITPGARGAILADWEGESVEQFSLDDPFDLKITAAHAGIILSHYKDVLAGFPVGSVQEIVLTTAKQHLVIGAIGPDYAMVMTLNRNAALSLALHSFRVSLQMLHREIY
jgi:predicted regulator of Ras-like GTPase activity (Roadblock/LC7/MglB family)